VEDDASSVALDVPRLGERGAERKTRVEGRHRLVQLRRHRGTLDVALRRRIDRYRRGEQHPDVIARSRGRRGVSGEDDRDEHGERRDRRESPAVPGCRAGQAGRHQAPVVVRGRSPKASIGRSIATGNRGLTVQA
jgi:hypothetical protein